ncbi:mitoferrin-like [Salvia hispanica]|uniref:mitoferrin-like n=1 Tax=Salvia hispanica TaxID=49212 RepID=UPI0020091745|nr:mitoferrin-like [Salvia hispanica]
MAADTSALPHDGLKFWQFMIAGSVAGMAEHMAMFPVDTIKTQMQALSSCPLNSATVNQAIRSILKSEGATGFYRGIAAMGIGAGPAHAVYDYEACKWSFSGGNPSSHAAAGVCATVASDGYGEAAPPAEGIGAFFVSYRTTVVMNAPFTAVHFATYEAAKRGLMNVSPESAGEEKFVVHATAGALAAAVTTPLDVVKTQLQCQGPGGMRV